MDKFYIIVLSIFTIFLILILTLIGTAIVYGDTAVQYPPVVSKCPDYWNMDDNGVCVNTTRNTINAGNGAEDTIKGINGVVRTKLSDADKNYCEGGSNNINCDIKPSDPKWLANGLTPICNQRKWANRNNILWDGVSNYNSC